MNDPAEIKIDSIEFSKAGSITFAGMVEGQSIVLTITSEDAAFDKFIPKMDSSKSFESFGCRDPDGLFNAVLDKFGNLHWHLKLKFGHITSVRIYVIPIIEEMLLDAYQKLQ